jgi:hypothetical protein
MCLIIRKCYAVLSVQTMAGNYAGGYSPADATDVSALVVCCAISFCLVFSFFSRFKLRGLKPGRPAVSTMEN